MPAKVIFLSRSGLEQLAGKKYFERGVRYFEDGAVVDFRSGEDGINARVMGTDHCPYATRLWVTAQGMHWGCTCPLGNDGAFCKHLVATGLTWLSRARRRSEPSENPDEIREALKVLDEPRLAEILGQRALWDESLRAELVLVARMVRSKKPRKQ